LSLDRPHQLQDRPNYARQAINNRRCHRNHYVPPALFAQVGGTINPGVQVGGRDQRAGRRDARPQVFTGTNAVWAIRAGCSVRNTPRQGVSANGVLTLKPAPWGFPRPRPLSRTSGGVLVSSYGPVATLSIFWGSRAGARTSAQTKRTLSFATRLPKLQAPPPSGAFSLQAARHAAGRPAIASISRALYSKTKNPRHEGSNVRPRKIGFCDPKETCDEFRRSQRRKDPAIGGVRRSAACSGDALKMCFADAATR
jgi:hypothetical protein